MKPNSRDHYGDGHGFRSPERREKLTVSPRFSYDLTRLDKFARGEEFLGLYVLPDGKKVINIIFRARQRNEEGGLRFLTRYGSQHPHYVTDPIAWAELPKP